MLARSSLGAAAAVRVVRSPAPGQGETGLVDTAAACDPPVAVVRGRVQQQRLSAGGEPQDARHLLAADASQTAGRDGIAAWLLQSTARCRMNLVLRSLMGPQGVLESAAAASSSGSRDTLVGFLEA